MPSCTRSRAPGHRRSVARGGRRRGCARRAGGRARRVAPRRRHRAARVRPGRRRQPGARRVDGARRRRRGVPLGAAYAVLQPDLGALPPPDARTRRRRTPPTVLVGLGGGQQAGAGSSIARQSARWARCRPGLSRARVLLSLGLDSSPIPRRRAAGRHRGHCRRAVSRGAGAGDRGGGRRRHDALRGVRARHAGGRSAGRRRPVDDGPAFRAGRAGRGRGERRRSARERVGPAAVGAAACRSAGRRRRADDIWRRGRLAIDGRGAARGWPRAHRGRCGRAHGQTRMD